MELTKEHRLLIENIIRKNPRFKGNEDLVDDFCSETFKRSYFAMSTIQNINHLDSYLGKIAGSAILSVLKDLGRLRKTKEGYEKIEEVKEFPTHAINNSGEIVYEIADPCIDIEEEIVNKSEIEKIKNIILKIDAEEPLKKYMEIFKMRYINGLKQSEIAENIGITQGEISKRLVELSTKINESIQ